MLPVPLAAPTAVVAANPAAVSTGAGAAAAAAPTGERIESAAPDTKPKYRNGLVVGLTLGLGIGRGAGYPNNSNDIGNPADRSASGWMPGVGESLVIMGALADYLNFGFMLSEDSFRSSNQRAVESGLGLRVEAFPFLELCPRLSGLGFLAQFGVGIGRLSTPGLPQAGGTQSYVGTGVFYEWAFGHVLGGHFAAGPMLQYDAMFSRPYDENGFVALGRFVFYGGP
jgi:hypothetical protein